MASGVAERYNNHHTKLPRLEIVSMHSRVIAALFVLILTVPASAADWPQFRGPNANGVAEGAKLPDAIGPEINVLWKVELPPGHSSPVVVGDRIYVTAVREKKELLTIALDRA